MHGYSYFTLGPNQTWPSLSSSDTHINTHTVINMKRYALKKHTHKLTTKEQPAHDGNRHQSVMAGWSRAGSVSAPETLEHTPKPTHTCKAHARNRNTGHGLQNVRLLDQFPCLPGFCDWPHSVLFLLSLHLASWTVLMTANQTQMAVLMLLLLLLLHGFCFLCFCMCMYVKVWRVNAFLLNILSTYFDFIYCFMRITNI